MATKKEEETMATKKEETKVQDKEYWEELVPYKIPIDRNNNDDVFVSVNDRTFQIKRGVEVKIPRNVAEVLNQAEQAQYEAFMKQQALQDEYESEARKLGA